MKKYQHLNNNLDYHMKADLTLIGSLIVYNHFPHLAQIQYICAALVVEIMIPASVTEPKSIYVN